MLRDVKRLLGSLYEEYDYEVDAAWVEGEIPRDLCGSYFRNGPGLQVTGEGYTRHAFDGDGMVCCFGFKDGRAWFKNKFVRTKGFVEEQAAGRPLYRSAFTTGSADGSPFFNPFDLDMKNVANTGVLHWAGRLLALFENGLPYEMDPRTLDTLGETRLGGAVNTKALGAHYRILRDPATGEKRWVTFAVEAGPQFKVTFFEFDEPGKLLHRQAYSLPDTMITILHDFTVTENYYVLVEGPIRFDIGKFLGSYLFSRCSVAACLVFDHGGKTRVHLVPRRAPRQGGGGGTAASAAAAAAEPRVFETQPFFSFHSGNAFELRSGGGGGAGAAAGPATHLVVDCAAWEYVDFEKFNYDVLDIDSGTGAGNQLDPSYYEGGARTHLVRVAVDLATGQTTYSRLARRTLEFPSVNPDWHGRPHRYLYCGGDAVDDETYWAPLQAVCRVEVAPGAGLRVPLDYDRDTRIDAWYAGPRSFVMEPVFVPKRRQTTTSGGNGNGGGGGAHAAEDDGWLLCTVYDAAAGRGTLCIFDAASVASGPVARIRLPHHLPSGLHGSWSQGFVSDDDDNGDLAGAGAAPKWREPNRIRPL